jgi:uncharacterized cupredoxin-like copper-binding protein/plastocyanin
VRPWLAFAVILVPACSMRGPATPTANVVTINATDYAFAAADTIVAGLTTFRLINAGREPHQAVVTGSPTKTFAELEAALMVEGPIPDWLTFPAAPGVVAAGDSSIVTTNVTPGNYVIVCFIPSPDGKLHVAKGMFRRLVVVAAPQGAGAAPEPTADVTVTLSDYAFTLSTPLTAGTHTIRVENAGPQLHEFTVERLLPGKTLADWQAWMAGGMRGRPPAEPAGGLVGPAKGQAGWLILTLQPGNYLLNCYVPDAKDGKPHFLHGMVQQITVS